MPEKVLTINKLSKSFGALPVLKEISLEVEKGEVVGIIGPSGSGKSTLLRCATMLETMDSGTLIYGDLTWKGVMLINRYCVPRVTVLGWYSRTSICFRTIQF